MGRKPLIPGQRRAALSIAVTQQQWRQVQDAAELHGVSASALARRAIAAYLVDIAKHKPLP